MKGVVMQQAVNMHPLLRTGAGIRIWGQGNVETDPLFRIEGIRGLHQAQGVIRLLEQELSLDAIAQVDYIATFAWRPATVQLARLLAIRLTARTGRRIGLLIVSRREREVDFRYLLPDMNDPAGVNHSDVVQELPRLNTDLARAYLAGKSALFFTDILRKQRDEGIIHMLWAFSVKRIETNVLALAALVIQHGGVRALLNRGSRQRRLPVHFIYHTRTKGTVAPDGAPPSAGPATESLLRSIWRRLNAPKTG